MNAGTLRDKYPNFVYKSFDSKQKGADLDLSFDFQILPDIEFKSKVVIKNVPSGTLDHFSKQAIDNLVFHLGLAEIPSYWKATCSPHISIEAGKLDDYQIAWWGKLFTEGMGQFFWENEIEVGPNFFTIESQGQTFEDKATVSGKKILIPVGGGKDSAVTLQLLRGHKYLAGVFMLNPTSASERLTRIARLDQRVTVERTIDPKLFALNAKGYLNGHTPFSSYLAFLSIFCAYIYGYSDIAFSNELSSDEANVMFNGRRINHQYSKTTEFEKDFREYNGKYLTNISYFSFLRPLHELQIAKLFSGMPQYFEAFRSCNVGQKTDSWCDHCSKCLSTYILLHPFLGHDQIRDIFSHDLFEDSSLYPILEQLVRDDMVKPFECVGTRVELKAALALSAQKLEKSGTSLPPILKKALDNGLFDVSMVTKAEDLLKDWSGNNFLSNDMEELLKGALK